MSFDGIVMGGIGSTYSSVCLHSRSKAADSNDTDEPVEDTDK